MIPGVSFGAYHLAVGQGRQHPVGVRMQCARRTPAHSPALREDEPGIADVPLRRGRDYSSLRSSPLTGAALRALSPLRSSPIDGHAPTNA